MEHNDILGLQQNIRNFFPVGDWEVDINFNHLQNEYAFFVVNKTKIGKADLLVGGYDKIIREISNNLENNLLLLNARTERESEIAALKNKLQEAELKIAELSLFKVHYDMEFKMKHGEKPSDKCLQI